MLNFFPLMFFFSLDDAHLDDLNLCNFYDVVIWKHNALL